MFIGRMGVLALAAAALAAAKTGVYRDRLGMYALPAPPGWTARTNGKLSVHVTSPEGVGI